MNRYLLPVLIAVFFWAYAIYCFFKSRAITHTVKGNGSVYAVMITLLGALLLIRDRSLPSILCVIAIIASGVFLSVIPGGYDEEAVYTLGKRIPFEKIQEVRREEDEKEVRLLVESEGRITVLRCERKDREKIDGLYHKLKKGREERI